MGVVNVLAQPNEGSGEETMTTFTCTQYPSSNRVNVNIPVTENAEYVRLHA